MKKPTANPCPACDSYDIIVRHVNENDVVRESIHCKTCEFTVYKRYNPKTYFEQRQNDLILKWNNTIIGKPTLYTIDRGGRHIVDLSILAGVSIILIMLVVLFLF